MSRKTIAGRSGQPGQHGFRPPLRALVAFEAAARCNSFNAAAQELHLTPSAISHQIAGIERQIGVELFARIGRGVQLTVVGASYYEKVRRILASLEEATREVINAGAQEVLTIHTPPSIAGRWLLPLLPSFIKNHPHIEVRVSAEPTRSGLSWDAVDLAILYGDAMPNDSAIEPFIDELIQPLCSPTILRNAPIKLPSDLLEHVLIHSNYNSITWKDWFAEHHVTGYARHRGIQIDPSHIAIEAAVKDFGIVLESSLIANEEVASGRLIAPLREYAVERTSYTLAWPSRRRLNDNVRIFRDWLVAAAPRSDRKQHGRQAARSKAARGKR